MAASYNKSSRSKKISGPGKSAGAGQLKPLGPGPAGMRKAGAAAAVTVGKGGMKGGKGC